MIKNDLISVIVPVYNCEKYINKCVDSITNQSYHNIEIILIDDGSTDNSYNICKIISDFDRRIKLFHTRNFGVSHARNLGIEKSTGEYLLFIDSDDFIKYNMIEKMYNNIKKYDADIAICNVAIVDENNNIIFKPKDRNNTIIMNTKEYVSNLYNKQTINGYPVNKLMKRSSISDCRFDEKIKHLEDWDFLCRMSKNVTRVVYDQNDFYYYYVSRNNSAVHQKFNESWTTDLLARERNIKFVDYYNDEDKIRFYFDYTINALNTLGYKYYVKKLSKAEKQKLIMIKNKYYKTIISSKYLTKFEKIKLFFKAKFPIMYYGLMKILKKG